MSLRGSYSARIDDRNRLKIPAEFRRFVESNYGNELFVTSLHGSEARIYPLPVWQEFEERLRKLGPFNPIRMRLQKVVNFYGQTQTMDAQGRVLVQSPLREKADLTKEVTVLGYTDHLYIQNREHIESAVEKPLSDDELAALDQLWSKE
jgi:MraZ protein